MEAAVVAHEMCNAAEQPEAERACAATVDCVIWAWAAEDFTPCPTVCGQEATLQQRAVGCEGSDGTVLAAGTMDAERECSDAGDAFMSDA